MSWVLAMFRKSTGQTSFLDVETFFPDALPENDWSFIYRNHVLPLIDEEKFRHLFAEKGGAPTKPIRTTVSVLLFMGMETLTWRAAEMMFPRRLDWLIATGTEIGKASIDHTTLYKFYLRLEADETARQVFVEITEKFMELCGTSKRKQRTDSFFIHGWLKILSRYGLFRETIRVFLTDLKKTEEDKFEGIAGRLSKEYVEKDFDLTEKEREKAQKRTVEMAGDMYVLIREFEKEETVREMESFGTLREVFGQQCEVVETEEDLEKVQIREKPEGEKIINSPHNTEAEYTKKGKQEVRGHKGFISETCGEENATQFITDVNATGSREADSQELEPIQERLEEGGMKPEEQYGDGGFVNGKTIVESKEKGIDLEGPSAGRSQSIEGYESEGRPLDTADFEVEVTVEKEELWVEGCPGGQAPIGQGRSGKTGKVNVHFDAEVCRSCELRDRCPVKIGKKVATLVIDEAGHAGAMRHQRYMTEQGYRKQCAIRAGVEGTVNELANTHGMRKARHRGLGRIRLQIIFAALGCNVKRFIRHRQKYGNLAVEGA